MQQDTNVVQQVKNEGEECNITIEHNEERGLEQYVAPEYRKK